MKNQIKKVAFLLGIVSGMSIYSMQQEGVGIEERPTLIGVPDEINIIEVIKQFDDVDQAGDALRNFALSRDGSKFTNFIIHELIKKVPNKDVYLQEYSFIRAALALRTPQAAEWLKNKFRDRRSFMRDVLDAVRELDLSTASGKQKINMLKKIAFVLPLPLEVIRGAENTISKLQEKWSALLSQRESPEEVSYRLLKNIDNIDEAGDALRDLTLFDNDPRITDFIIEGLIKKVPNKDKYQPVYSFIHAALALRTPQAAEWLKNKFRDRRSFMVDALDVVRELDLSTARGKQKINMLKKIALVLPLPLEVIRGAENTISATQEKWENIGQQ